jgi:hypothetical protein
LAHAENTLINRPPNAAAGDHDDGGARSGEQRATADESICGFS